MQGRFKAILVEDANWARELSLYVHLNPVMRKGMGLDKRGKKAESQGLRGASPEENARRQQALRAYRWSSYRAYAGYARKPKWLTTAEILARGPDDARRREAAYRQEVQSRLLKGGDSTVAESIRDRFAVGSERFRASILKVVKGGREVTVPAGLQIRANWQDILRAVETVTGVPSSDYLAKRGMRGKPLALWAARQCGAMTLREIGREAGGMDYAAVSISIKRLEALAQTDRQVRCEMEEVKRLLNVET
jgi:hypothetical protein